METNRIAGIFLTMLLWTVASSQTFPIQLSTESVPLNQRPLVYASPTGEIWVAYVTSTSRLVAGYFLDGSWIRTASFVSSRTIRLDYPVRATVDESDRVWFFYSDSSFGSQGRWAIGHIGYFEGSNWHQVDSIEIRGSGAPVPYFVPTYDLIRNAGNGVWFTIDQIVYRNNVVTHEMRATHAIGNQIRSTKVAVSDPEMFGFTGSVSTPFDSILTGFTHTYIIQGNSTHRYTWSRYAKSNSAAIAGLDSGYYCSGICGPGSGVIASTLSVGSNGRGALLLAKIFSTTSSSWYRAYLVDNTLRTKWMNILSHADYDNEIALSSQSDIATLAWFSHDTLRMKALAENVWCQPITHAETVVDSGRRNPSVAVALDSSAWITFTAMKNNARHVFLTRVQLSFVSDPLVTSVQERNPLEAPSQFSLSQNYPNPFNPTTTIKFQIPSINVVTLKILDLLGREVTTLVNEEMEPGIYGRVLDGRGLASGMYLYRMQAGSFSETKKLLIVR